MEFLPPRTSHLHLESEFLKYECAQYLKKYLLPSQHEIVDAYRTSNLGLALKLAGGRSPQYFQEAIFIVLYNVVEIETHLCSNVPFIIHWRHVFLLVSQCRAK